MGAIDPLKWLNTANERRPKFAGVTDWFPGTVKPAHVGCYERHFTDSTVNDPSASFQFWDGTQWIVMSTGMPHWRQVGQYPAWRGLTYRFEAGEELRLIRGSRGRLNGPGCERQVRAKLISIDPLMNLVCTLLEDDPLATAKPNKAGESGVWHGLSFIADCISFEQYRIAN